MARSNKSFITFKALSIATTNLDPYQGVFVLSMEYKNLENTKESVIEILDTIEEMYTSNFPINYPKILLLNESFSTMESELISNTAEYNDLKRFILTLKSKGFLTCVVSTDKLSPFYPIADINIAWLTELTWHGYAFNTLYYKPSVFPIEALPKIAPNFQHHSRYILFPSFAEAQKNLKSIKQLNQTWRLAVLQPALKFELKGGK